MSKLIIANWKMNLSIDQAQHFIGKIKTTASSKVAIAAPYTFLDRLGKITAKNKVSLGAQNVAAYESGAYTGEISAKMLKEVGCRYVLVGHSERRVYFAETDEIINEKIKLLLKNNLEPVLCFGENWQQRKNGESKKQVKNQLLKALAGIKDISKITFAYEPIWAISTFQKSKVKQSASFEDISIMHEHIVSVLKNRFKSQAKKAKVLYGGTVKPENAKDILSLPMVNGALVGGASLKVSSFNAIIQSIN